MHAFITWTCRCLLLLGGGCLLYVGPDSFRDALEQFSEWSENKPDGAVSPYEAGRLLAQRYRLEVAESQLWDAIQTMVMGAIAVLAAVASWPRKS